MRYYSLILISILVLIQACKKNEENEDENNEVIVQPIEGLNRLEIDFICEADSTKNTFFKLATINTPTMLEHPTLFSSTKYDCKVRFYSGDSNAHVNRTNEIIQNSEHYQFFFWVSNGFIIDSFEYNDMDKDGFPIGINYSMTTSSWNDTFSFGSDLRFELDKNLPGLSEGKIDSADGLSVHSFDGNGSLYYMY